MAYITSQGEELLKGAVRIDPDPEGASGILCACCSHSHLLLPVRGARRAGVPPRALRQHFHRRRPLAAQGAPRQLCTFHGMASAGTLA